MTEPKVLKSRCDWWIYAALLLVVVQAATVFGAYQRLGKASSVLWYFGTGLFPPAALIVLVIGLAWSLRKRPILRRLRVLGCAMLLAVLVSPYLMHTYPSSH
ncbi:MAG TPA: hypothetical protein VGX76_11510, partial [Pirellulales bacterium]|nr:hypothetical protein [Pirellulales bacterium]